MEADFNRAISSLQNGLPAPENSNHNANLLRQSTVTPPANANNVLTTPTNSPHAVALIMGVLSVLTGLTGLLGWLTESDWLCSLGTAEASMKANTALMLLLLGIYLVWVVLAKKKLSAARLASLLPGAVLLLAGLTVLEYATDLNLGIDEWLFRDPFTNPLISPPGRPSLLVSRCLLCLSASVLLSEQRRGLRVGQGLALLVVLVAYSVILGYITGTRSFYAFGNSLLVALHTALALLAVGVGVLGLNPRHGLMHTAGSLYWGGVITRYVAAYVLLVPPLLAFLYQTGISRQMLALETGLPFVLFIFMFISLMLFYGVVNRLNRLDEQSRDQYRQLQNTEQAAKEQADLLESISNASQTGVTAFTALRDEAGVIVDFVYAYRNDTVFRISGKAAHERVGQRLLSQYPTTHEVGVFDRFVRVVETGEPITFDQQYAADGLDRWFALSVCRWGDGIVVDSNDISKLRRAEQEKLHQAEFIDTVLNSVTCGVMVATAIRGADGQIEDLLITEVNEQSMTLLKMTRANVIGQRHNLLFTDAPTNGVFAAFARTIETDESQQLEFYFREGHRPFWVDLNTQKLGDGVVVTWTDISDRKQAEIALQQRNNTFQELVNNTQAGILLARPVRNEENQITDFRYVLTNEFNARTTGKSVGSMVDALVSDLFPGWQASDLFRKYVDVVETGQPHRETFPYEACGMKGWFDASFSCVDGCMLYTYTDVTTLKEAEQALQRQNKVLMGIVENGKAGISLFDPVRDKSGAITDFRYVFTNAINSYNTGRSVAEMTGNTLLSFFPGVARTDWYARLLRTANTGTSESFLFAYEGDNILGWFDTLFVKLGDQVLFTDLNVTDLKAAELERTKQAELLERVMNTTPTAIVLHESIRDEAGQIVDFRMTRINQPAADLMQMPIDQIEHRRISRFFPDILRSEAFDHYRQVVETGEPTRFEVQLADRWYDFSVARFGDGIVVAAQDSTDNRLYRHQLEVVNHELRRSNENLESFANVASHDLQEPLRKLISFANILQTQYAGQLAPEVSDILNRMNISAERMRLLIQDLLTYSRVGTQQDAIKAVDLTRVIQELQENELWAAIYANKAELRLGQLPTLRADPFQIRQLFQNLLSNAIKFCSPGVLPVVSITCRTVDRAEIPVGLLSPVKAGDNKPTGQTFYEIEVTDNGIGFDEKYLNRIFQVFQRLHGRNQYAGSGIGLAICQKITERHNGAITATSTPGEGSTFRVFLPVGN